MLKIRGISIILLILAGAFIVPVGTSYAAYDDSPAFNPGLRTQENQTNSNMTMPQSSTAGSTGTTGNQTNSNMTMPQSSTTGSTGYTGTTGNIGTQTNTNQTNTINDTRDAQEISTFIHQSHVDFTKQKSETRSAMLDCRDKIQTSTPSTLAKIKAGCTTQLSEIKLKYQDERSHLHDLISKYRQSVMVFLSDARGVKVSKADMDKALSDLINKMNAETASSGMTGPVLTGLMAKTNNTNCVNPPGGPAIC